MWNGMNDMVENKIFEQKFNYPFDNAEKINQGKQ